MAVQRSIGLDSTAEQEWDEEHWRDYETFSESVETRLEVEKELGLSTKQDIEEFISKEKRAQVYFWLCFS